MIFYLILFSSFLYSDTQCWTYSIYASGRRSSISQSVVWWCGIDYVGPTSHTYILRYADCVHVNSASGYRYDVIDWPSISRLPSWLLSRSLSSHIHRISLPSLSLTSLFFSSSPTFTAVCHFCSLLAMSIMHRKDPILMCFLFGLQLSVRSFSA